MASNQLTAEMFRAIIAGLTQKLEKGAERRAELRVGFRVRVTLHPFDEGRLGKALNGWCRNLSEKGIGIMADTPIKVGRQFILAMDGEEGQMLCYIYGVTGCVRQGSGPYLLGGRLLEEMNGSVFQSLRDATLVPLKPVGAAPNRGVTPQEPATGMPGNAPAITKKAVASDQLPLNPATPDPMRKFHELMRGKVAP